MLKKYAVMTGFIIWRVLVLSFSGAAFATCKVPPETMVAYPFQAAFTEDECHFVAYKQDGKVEVVVEYPEMKIVEARAGSDKGRMTLQFWYLPIPEDGVDHAVVGVPLLNAGPITSFRVGRNWVSTFLGRDGREVYVNGYENINRVGRKFFINIQGTYQYSVEHADLRVMDDFALDFFKTMMVGNLAIK
ncbi:exported hypothetical protein [Pseudomonas sp. IT-P253]|uniref:hypothetical protein n=1 Tax=Pseudomonas sp. IT-P253 TaxID=3026455 RepID=UPI0039DF569A